MNKKIALISILMALVCVTFFGCEALPEQGAVAFGGTQSEKVMQEIMSEQKGKVITIGDADETFALRGVTEDASSAAVANAKYELNLDASVTEGNKYDPSEVDIVGQFVSPSGELYEMPAFWYIDYDRSFEAYDEDGEFDIVSDGTCFAQGNASVCGVLDDFGGQKTPVAKITFSKDDVSQSANGGAVLSKGGVTVVHDTISLWLKAGENLQTDGLYLYIYGSNDQAYVKLPTLTDTWQKYTFLYGKETERVEYEQNGSVTEIECLTQEALAQSDFTHNNTQYPRPLSNMYSVRIQPGNGLNDQYTATGDVYIADVQFYNSALPAQSTQLASFRGEIFDNYIAGDLFGCEVIEKTGAENFKLRFRFTEPGEWTYRIVGKKNGKEKFKYTASVDVAANADEEANRGVIRVEPTLRRNFVFEDGTPYVPIGMNLAYSVDSKRGSYDYEVYFPKMAAAGMNYSRTWLTDIDAGYGVQSVEGGILNFDARQYKACQFDNILELAEEYGLYLQIPMQAISPFRKDDVSGERTHHWDTNPYNVMNGGYLEEPWEYFTDARAMEDTKKLYRYYVARFGYSRNILGWELMNEIGMDTSWYGTELCTQEQAQAWANEIGSYMHAIDPYRHLVTISSGNDHYDKVYGADAVDFINFHSYVFGSNYSTSAPNECYALWQEFDKPVLVGEMGASGTSESYNHDRDPNGLMNKQTSFSAPMGGSAGGAMTFWWQQVNQYDQYSNWTPAANYFKSLKANIAVMDLLRSQQYSVGGTNAGRVVVYGYVSDTALYAYVTDTQYNYANSNPGTFADTTLTFTGLADGEFTVQVFDTDTGTVANTYKATASGGTLVLDLDAWSCDLALIVDKV